MYVYTYMFMYIYKVAATIAEATSLGAQWQDISADYEKEFLSMQNADVPMVSERSVPECTPNREASNRAKQKSREL